MEKSHNKFSAEESEDENFFYYSFELEKQWKKSQPKLTSRELFDIYKPDPKMLRLNIKMWKEEQNEARREIKELFKTFKEKSPKDMYFAEAYAEHFHYPIFQKARQNIFRLKALLAMSHDKKTRISNFNEQVEIARNYPIELLARNKLELKPSGNNFLTNCIFHNDDHPSMMIYTDSNHFHCFSCSAHGDSINFLMALEGISFAEALKMLQSI